MNVLIFGGSGSGTSTLAYEFAAKHNWKHLDADDFYWEKTHPPFQEKVPLKIRSKRLMESVIINDDVVLSGSLVSWGDEWLSMFNLSVFLHIPHLIRLERLKKREIERYGPKQEWSDKIEADSIKFLEWASMYDNPEFLGRNISLHKEYIQLLECPTIIIEGDTSIEERMKRIKVY